MIKKSLQRIFLSLLVLSLQGCQLGFNQQPSEPDGFVRSADAVRIHFHKAGDGDTALVFVHCWSCDGSYWEPQLEYFANHYQVVDVDLAGHGESGIDRENFTIELFAEDIAAVVKGLNLNRVILVGHSMGGATVVEAAQLLPDQVIGVVAVDSFANPQQWPAAEDIDAVVAPYRQEFSKNTYAKVKSMFAAHTGKALIYRIANDMAAAPPEVGISAMSNLLTWMANEYKKQVAELTVPLIQINARHDGDRASEEEIIVVQGVGHFIPQETPKRFNEALEKAIAMISE